METESIPVSDEASVKVSSKRKSGLFQKLFRRSMGPSGTPSYQNTDKSASDETKLQSQMSNLSDVGYSQSLTSLSEEEDPSIDRVPKDDLNTYVVNITEDMMKKSSLYKEWQKNGKIELFKAFLVGKALISVRQALEPHLKDSDREKFRRLKLDKVINSRVKIIVDKFCNDKKQRALAENNSNRLVGAVYTLTEMGKRDYNEDRFLSEPFLREYRNSTTERWDNLSFFGVFDGHGGEQCAEFVSKNLYLNLAQSQYLSKSVKAALEESFHLTNEAWISRCINSDDSKLADCGSTGVVSVIDGKYLHMAWVGDSAGILFMKNGVWLDFVKPHKPSDESEKKRIEELGGKITDNCRVNGSLAVTRAFGDLQYGCIQPEPDIVDYTLTGEEEFLLLACDGLTDVMTPIDILEVVKAEESKDPKGYERTIADVLIREALDRGSNDNITVIYVSMKDITPHTISQLPIKMSEKIELNFKKEPATKRDSAKMIDDIFSAYGM